MSDPAFPTIVQNEHGGEVTCSGVTIRELFAAMAMANMATGFDAEDCVDSVGRLQSKWIAKASVILADDLIAELSKGSK